MSLFSGEKTVNQVLAGTPTISLPAGLTGTVAGDNAASGIIGEVVSAIKAVGAAVALTTATPANILSISLTAGDWDVTGLVNFTGGSATTAAGGLFTGGINTVSATVPTDGSETPVGVPAVTTTSFLAGTAVQKKRINVTGTTTVYLVGEATFSAGTVGGYGAIIARRVR